MSGPSNPIEKVPVIDMKRTVSGAHRPYIHYGMPIFNRLINPTTVEKMMKLPTKFHTVTLWHVIDVKQCILLLYCIVSKTPC